MLDPGLSVRDNMNHATSLSMKSSYNNNNSNQLPRIEDRNNYNEHNEHHNHNTILTFPVSLRKTEDLLNRYSRMKEDHFPTKLYRMLEDVERFGDKSVISWSHDRLFFLVHQPKVFAESWMKKYFKQSKYKR